MNNLMNTERVDLRPMWKREVKIMDHHDLNLKTGRKMNGAGRKIQAIILLASAASASSVSAGLGAETAALA